MLSKYPKPKEGEPPSELPPPYKDEDDEWVWKDQTAFFHKKVEELRPFLPGLNLAAQEVAQEQERPAPPNVDPKTGEVHEELDYVKEPDILPPSQTPPEEEVDDLPF